MYQPLDDCRYDYGGCMPHHSHNKTTSGHVGYGCNGAYHVNNAPTPPRVYEIKVEEIKGDFFSDVKTRLFLDVELPIHNDHQYYSKITTDKGLVVDSYVENNELINYYNPWEIFSCNGVKFSDCSILMTSIKNKTYNKVSQKFQLASIRDDVVPYIQLQCRAKLLKSFGQQYREGDIVTLFLKSVTTLPLIVVRMSHSQVFIPLDEGQQIQVISGNDSLLEWRLNDLSYSHTKTVGDLRCDYFSSDTKIKKPEVIFSTSKELKYPKHVIVLPNVSRTTCVIEPSDNSCICAHNLDEVYLRTFDSMPVKVNSAKHLKLVHVEGNDNWNEFKIKIIQPTPYILLEKNTWTWTARVPSKKT